LKEFQLQFIHPHIIHYYIPCSGAIGGNVNCITLLGHSSKEEG